MEDNTYIVRISSRFNTDSDWRAVDPVLLQGELAIVYIKSDIPNTLPEVRIKSGDGIHKYSELPFVSANSLDVYAWAKQKNKPSYHADEIIGLENYNNHKHNISDIIGLQEELDKKGEFPSNDNDSDSSDSSDDTSNGVVGENCQIIANTKDGLYALQDGDNVIIGINNKITFTLDGGDSSQFQS
jgi:hypothetical protein